MILTISGSRTTFTTRVGEPHHSWECPYTAGCEDCIEGSRYTATEYDVSLAYFPDEEPELPQKRATRPTVRFVKPIVRQRAHLFIHKPGVGYGFFRG